MYTRSSKLFRAFIHEASVNQYHCLDTIKGKRIKFQTCPFSTSSKSLNMVCVVSTSSRGIGLEFTRQLLSKPGTTVIALVRGPESSLHASSPSSLLALKSAYPNHLHIIDNVDLENPTTFPMVRQRITKLTSHVDLLVNSAGILGDASTTPGPERSITRVENNWTTKTFQINTIAPMMLTKELLDLLKEGGKKTKSMKNDEKIPANTTESGSVAPPPARVLNVSARVGSIGDNKTGGWYSYRMSKAALNMFTKTLALETMRFNVAAFSIHPGTVDTDLSKPFQKAVRKDKLFTVSQSVQLMLQVVMRKGLEDSGKFFAYDGSPIEF